uniref:Uncharacterized protein n=1 Tax=Microcebus murinus TaxID=30608 RepID=A0A8C5YHJ8_MICMU
MISVITAQGDIWNPWATMLASVSGFYIQQHLWRILKHTGCPMSGGHRGNPESAIIHSISFNKIFLSLFSNALPP